LKLMRARFKTSVGIYIFNCRARTWRYD